MLERLAVRHLRIRWPGRVTGFRATWDQLDLEHGGDPTLTCGLDELKKLA